MQNKEYRVSLPRKVQVVYKFEDFGGTGKEEI